MMSEGIAGAANPHEAAVQDMGVDHRRVHVAMAQKFLNRLDIVTTFEQGRCERIAESMAHRELGSVNGGW
jgi:hypothetical protein